MLPVVFIVSLVGLYWLCGLGNTLLDLREGRYARAFVVGVLVVCSAVVFGSYFATAL